MKRKSKQNFNNNAKEGLNSYRFKIRNPELKLNNHKFLSANNRWVYVQGSIYIGVFLTKDHQTQSFRCFLGKGKYNNCKGSICIQKIKLSEDKFEFKNYGYIVTNHSDSCLNKNVAEREVRGNCFTKTKEKLRKLSRKMDLEVDDFNNNTNELMMMNVKEEIKLEEEINEKNEKDLEICDLFSKGKYFLSNNEKIIQEKENSISLLEEENKKLKILLEEEQKEKIKMEEENIILRELNLNKNDTLNALNNLLMYYKSKVNLD